MDRCSGWGQVGSFAASGERCVPLARVQRFATTFEMSVNAVIEDFGASRAYRPTIRDNEAVGSDKVFSGFTGAAPVLRLSAVRNAVWQVKRTARVCTHTPSCSLLTLAARERLVMKILDGLSED